jgi:serine/threonine protein kinase
MAPEIFNNEPYSLKADVYSYGIVLWEILSQTPPYTNLKNPQSLMKFITVENGRPDLNLITEDCPTEIKSLMIRCWDQFQ